MALRFAWVVLLVACSHDWSDLDPRLGGNGTGGQATGAGPTTGGSSAGGAGTGANATGGAGTGATGTGAMGTGGSGTGAMGTGGSGTGGAPPCNGSCGLPTPVCDPASMECVECLIDNDCNGSQSQCQGKSCCAPIGNECNSGNDCCGNVPCQPGNFCAPMPGCTKNGDSCMVADDCCSGNCDAGDCRPVD